MQVRRLGNWGIPILDKNISNLSEWHAVQHFQRNRVIMVKSISYISSLCLSNLGIREGWSPSMFNNSCTSACGRSTPGEYPPLLYYRAGYRRPFKRPTPWVCDRPLVAAKRQLALWVITAFYNGGFTGDARSSLFQKEIF